MDIIILLGAPGSGKGTVSARVAEACGYRHLSTGDQLRQAVAARTAVGREAQPYILRGDLVPDAVMIRIVAEAMTAEPPERQRFLLDGFPRNIEQAGLLDAWLQEAGGRLVAVILLEAPEDVLIARLAGRRICRRCGATYHVVNIPPQREGKCDHCGGALVQRPDDNEATVSNRLAVYRRQTAALLRRYGRDTGLLRVVDSARPLGETVAEISGLMNCGAP